ncbi:ParA family protein (plasmid) [Streptomyces sp. NBC_01310]|uniref:ParA family protein n=1 Tax=unclassified Streptomyces TaxID=2593676 RepID=UPI002E2AB22E|nr:ParA family protein [Streptomyces sp. NBC_00239]WSJ64447.1 ParA family protein [Streptomyces sp. NBC_01310]
MSTIVRQRNLEAAKGGDFPIAHTPAEGFELPNGETKVFVVGMLKGGVGKTRLSMLMAFFLAMLGFRVVFIDADSTSQSAHLWKTRVEGQGQKLPFDMIPYPLDDLDRKIDEYRSRGDVDYVICDIGGGNTNAFMAAVRRARKLIIPIGADQSEVDRLNPTRMAAQGASTMSTVGGCEIYVAFNKIDRRRKKKSNQFRSVLEGEAQEGGAYPLCFTEIPQLAAYADAYGHLIDDFDFQGEFEMLDYLLHETGIWEFKRLVEEFEDDEERVEV